MYNLTSRVKLAQVDLHAVAVTVHVNHHGCVHEIVSIASTQCTGKPVATI